MAVKEMQVMISIKYDKVNAKWSAVVKTNNMDGRIEI